jgi:thiol-disulfide isomerase/thioredoxin
VNFARDSKPVQEEQENGRGSRRGPGIFAYGMLAALALGAGALSAFLIRAGRQDIQEGRRVEAIRQAPAAPAAIQKLVRLKEPQAAPDISFIDAKGKTRHLQEWRGKVVLLNLWATWCAPCKVEMPSLDRLQAKLGSDKFTVLAVSTDRTGPKEPEAFLAKAGITHLALYNDPAANALVQLKAEGLPVNVILDREGREAARLLGPAEWDSEQTIAELEKYIQ